MVVDHKGVVRLAEHPRRLNAWVVQQAAAGKMPKSRGERVTSNLTRDAMFEVTISPSVTGEFLASKSRGRLELHGRNLKQLLSDAFGVGLPRIVLEDSFPEFRYDARVVRGHHDLELQELLKEAIEAAFGLTATLKVRKTPVFVLQTAGFSEQAIQNLPPRTRLSMNQDGIKGGSWKPCDPAITS